LVTVSDKAGTASVTGVRAFLHEVVPTGWHQADTSAATAALSAGIADLLTAEADFMAADSAGAAVDFEAEVADSAEAEAVDAEAADAAGSGLSTGAFTGKALTTTVRAVQQPRIGRQRWMSLTGV
jgi:hypothetical protein